MNVQSYGAVEFKVTPEVLKQQAAEVTARIHATTRLFEDLRQILRNTRGYWIGEAGNLYRQSYEDKQGDLDILFRRLEEHPKDLLRIAGIYEEGERDIMETIATLGGNAIH